MIVDGIANIVYRDKSKIHNIEIDVIVKESATSSSKITKHPVEQGCEFSDHKIQLPMSFSCSGVVSNYSSNLLDLADTFSKNKSFDVWQKLLTLQRTGNSFMLVQSLCSYDNIQLTSITMTKDADKKNGLFFDASFQEVIIIGDGVKETVKYNPDMFDRMASDIHGGFQQLGVM
ncbi:MAG: hypothetical protein OMM_00556 [Candidatus Magnetoglobus multicellularis str. Araruama]|uniref:Dit-like phage tail protein N-terminal domain-containing protein n=1 Tax=Candidatus Magnetoglobus multicellularis str. Araruama TaxID=890399 RepID=A0A1V1PGF3_9BACT|nr:MAG: hypothetical protein OMM_00556 [Candidatus Magnetoglobus multicellularis str. Araruama]